MAVKKPKKQQDVLDPFRQPDDAPVPAAGPPGALAEPGWTDPPPDPAVT